MKNKKMRLRLFGRVQGVFFRQFARAQAKKLNLKCAATNQEDGSLIIEAEGDEENLREFIKQCRKGPVFAKVEKMEIQDLMQNNSL